MAKKPNPFAKMEKEGKDTKDGKGVKDTAANPAGFGGTPKAAKVNPFAKKAK